MMILGLLTFLLVAGSSNAFNLDFLSNILPAEPVAQCGWDTMTFAEQNPVDRQKICYANEPVYDEGVIRRALEQDQRAAYVLKNIIQMYQPMNETYFGSYNGFRTVEMCSVEPEIVLRVNVTLPQSFGRNVICNVVEPYHQSIYTAICGRNCQYAYETHASDMCIPDGYIQRYSVVYCPSLRKQCQIVQLNLPVGCSCKKYTCLKTF